MPADTANAATGPAAECPDLSGGSRVASSSVSQTSWRRTSVPARKSIGQWIESKLKELLAPNKTSPTAYHMGFPQ
jgi:hypothetical protein